MNLLTQEQYEKMLQNGIAQQKADQAGDMEDFYPVVKLFTPDANATWLLTEIHPNDNDIAFGLCDLGVGFPEIGSVSLSEILSVRGPYGLPIERDLHFVADKRLSDYAAEALEQGRIVTPSALGDGRGCLLVTVVNDPRNDDTIFLSPFLEGDGQDPDSEIPF
ncbi:MAG: DUF2958 domain-containing protein [bacterium]|nr:DUF2958 domain-containing protein [bacterium]